MTPCNSAAMPYIKFQAIWMRALFCCYMRTDGGTRRLYDLRIIYSIYLKKTRIYKKILLNQHYIKNNTMHGISNILRFTVNYIILNICDNLTIICELSGLYCDYNGAVHKIYLQVLTFCMRSECL